MSYKIKLDVFEGPFDLLLHLIKISEMDIYDIKISEITKQYLEYIRLMEQLDLELAGEYLVMAATLINIKARTLLPTHDDDNLEDEIDEIMSTKELIRQLVEYRKYKELAQSLRTKESQNLNVFYRTNIVPIFPHIEQQEDPVQEDIKRLFDAFTRVISFIDKKNLHQVSLEEYSIDDKITLIRTQLESAEQILLNKLFENCFSKSEIIVTFLASLELARLREIKILQSSTFKEIYIVKRPADEIIQIIEPVEEEMPINAEPVDSATSEMQQQTQVIQVEPAQQENLPNDDKQENNSDISKTLKSENDNNIENKE